MYSTLFCRDIFSDVKLRDSAKVMLTELVQQADRHVSDCVDLPYCIQQKWEK